MQANSGIIFDIKKYSIHDGPGIRTTVFFKGCPLRCWWCHNPESQSLKPEVMLRANRCLHCGACQEVCEQGAICAYEENQAEYSMPGINRERCTQCGACVELCYSGARELVGYEATIDAVLAEIERDRPFYDQSSGGVTFSGGEPLMQPEFLLGLLQACQAAELHTALDTCGYAPWSVVEKVAAQVDLFLFDLKLIDEDSHRRTSGVSNRLILQNLRQLSASGANLLVRLPLIPGINDDETSLRLAGEFLSCLVHPPHLEIIPYHSIAEAKYAALGKRYRLPGLKTPTPEKMTWTLHLLQSFGLQVKAQSLIQGS